MKPLAAALGLALVAPLMIGTALAAGQGNVPVNGTVFQGSAAGTATGTASLGSTGVGSLTVTLNSTANIINWSNPNNTATINPSSTLAGFNIGVGSTVTFSTSASAPKAVVLNTDNSGNLSTLDGSLSGGSDVNVFVANANGIVVGNKAVLSAPVLGLIAANVNDTSFIASTTAQQIALSFASAGSISIANGAQLNANGDPVLIAGAGTVNIQSTNAASISSKLIVDGGVSGLYNSTNTAASSTEQAVLPSFKTTTSVGNVALTTAPTNVSLNLGTAGGVFTLSSVYADGNITNAGNVDLSASPEFTGTLINNGIINNVKDQELIIGGTPSAGEIDDVTNIYVNTTSPALFGSVVNNGTIAAAIGFNLGLSGTFTNTTNAKLNVTGSALLLNTGFSNAGIVSVSSLSNTAVGDFTNIGGDFNNSGTINVNGSMDVSGETTNLLNGQPQYQEIGFANTGTMSIANNVNGKNTIAAYGGTVSNSGSMVFGNTGSTANSQSLTVTDGNFSNTGTLSLIGTSTFSVVSAVSGTLAGSFSANTLSTMTFMAGNNEGDMAQINTNTISSSNTVNLSGFNVDLGSSVSGKNTTVTVGGNPSVNLGVLTVASGATLAGSTILTVNAYSAGFANVSAAGTLAGSIVDLGTATTKKQTTSSGTLYSTTQNSLNNINVGGGIKADTVQITATGVVNKAMGGGNAAQNYLDNAAVITPYTAGSAVNLNVDAVGNHVQTWNIKADGNLNASSATNNFRTAGLNNGSSNGTGMVGETYFTPAANAYSQLRLQSTGNLSLVGGTGLDISGTGSFTWPGQIVAIAKGNLVTTASVDNAFTNTGAYNGIFLQGNALKIIAPIYTNGGAWINFSQTGYGSNGITSNPAFMTGYYQLSEPMNNSTGVVSYASKPIDSSSLKLGRQFLKGFTPSSN